MVDTPAAGGGVAMNTRETTHSTKPAVEWVVGAAGFAELAGKWDGLLPDDARPFDLHCWYEAWWESFGGGEEPAVCTVHRDGELVGVFPLRGRGRRLRSLANVHSCSFRPLARDPEALEALVGAVLERSPGGLEIYALPQDDLSVPVLESALRRAAMPSLTEPLYAAPFVDTRGDFDVWRKQNKSRWKAPLEQKRRKMDRDHEAEFRLVEPPRDLEAELDVGFQVEASGWKGEEGTAIDSTPETADFYRRIARAFHERGELRLNSILLDGDLVFFGLCILHGNRLYTLKSGFDETYRKLAPGLVSQLVVIERCFELGIDAVELLGEAKGWKMRFASETRPYLWMHAYSGGPLGRARHAYRARLRPLLKHTRERLSEARS